MVTLINKVQALNHPRIEGA